MSDAGRTRGPPRSASLPLVPAPAGGRAADPPVVAGKGAKAQKIGLQRQAWARVWLQIVGAASQIAVGVTAAATQDVQGRLCRKPAAVLAARSCARPLGRGAGGRPRSREIASCRWPYAPREHTNCEDGRSFRLKRWRAAHVAGIFRPSAGRPRNNRAVHRPEARHSSSAAWRSLALGLRAVFAHAPQFWTCNL